MKKLRIKKSIIDKTPLAFFYLTIIVMTLLIGFNNRSKNNQENDTTELPIQAVLINNNFLKLFM